MWLGTQKRVGTHLQIIFCSRFNVNPFWTRRKGTSPIPRFCLNIDHASLRKQPTFGDAIIGFPAKWRLRSERRNSILMTRHYSDLDSASDWWIKFSTRHDQSEALPRSWVVTRHQYGISALVSQTSFGGETSGSVAKCRLFSQAMIMHIQMN